jgi:hypothetical protein
MMTCWFGPTSLYSTVSHATGPSSDTAMLGVPPPGQGALIHRWKAVSECVSASESEIWLLAFCCTLNPTHALLHQSGIAPGGE